MKNPYRWNVVHPDLFYGKDRHDLVNEMYRQLVGLNGYSRSSFGLIGGRRMGKSTLLRKLEEELKTKAAKLQSRGKTVFPIYLDGSSLPTPLTSNYVWRLIATHIHSTLGKDIHSLPQLENVDDLTNYLIHTFSNLNSDPCVVLMFDEIKWLIETNWGRAFRDNLRYILTNSPDLMSNFSVVFSGAHEMAELNLDKVSPVGNVLEWRRLRNLTFEDSCQLMQKPIRYTWTDSFLNLAYSETGGHVMLLQYLMQRVCEGKAQDAEKSLKNAIATYEQNQSSQFSYWWDKYCSREAKIIYSKLRDDGKSMPKIDLIAGLGTLNANIALETLEAMGIVTLTNNNMRVQYSGEMFHRWYKNNISEFEDQGIEQDNLVGNYSRLSTSKQNLNYNNSDFHQDINVYIQNSPSISDEGTDMKQKSAIKQKNNAWINGSFYLFACVTILAILATISRLISPVALPIVFLAGILFVAVIGALQLRNDEQLSEKNFIQLMLETFKRLPFLRKST